MADDEINYGMDHRPPDRNTGAPLHDMTGQGHVYPADIYGQNAAHYYGDLGGGHPIDRGSISIIHQLRGKPNAKATIYRAVPDHLPNSEINPGDWVTINRQYARNHGEGTLNGKYKIIKKSVRADEVFGNNDSIHEFGYWPRPATSKPDRSAAKPARALIQQPSAIVDEALRTVAKRR